MYVTIVATKYGNCPEYQGAELKVPATREAIQDAMDRARAQGDEAYRMITFRDWPSFLRERLYGAAGSRRRDFSFVFSIP